MSDFPDASGGGSHVVSPEMAMSPVVMGGGGSGSGSKPPVLFTNGLGSRNVSSSSSSSTNQMSSTSSSTQKVSDRNGFRIESSLRRPLPVYSESRDQEEKTDETLKDFGCVNN